MTPVRRRHAVRPPDLDGGAGGIGRPLVNHPGRATAAAPAVRWQGPVPGGVGDQVAGGSHQSTPHRVKITTRHQTDTSRRISTACRLGTANAHARARLVQHCRPPLPPGRQPVIALVVALLTVVTGTEDVAEPERRARWGQHIPAARVPSPAAPRDHGRFG